MDVTKTSLHHINPHNFPAKLWLLANNPKITSIFWDSQGEAIIVNPYAFEKDILSPGSINLPDRDRFRTTNYTSFVRQLNLYGFRKFQPANKENPTFDHFVNPNFKKNCPELVSTLRRLTVRNKAKMLAGVTINNLPVRRESRYKRATTGEDADRDGGHIDQASTWPHYFTNAGSPVPPQKRKVDAAYWPAAFASGSVNPASLTRYYYGETSIPNRNIQKYSAYHPPGFQVCHPHPVAPHLAGSGTALVPSQRFYQTQYPVNTLHGGDHNRSSLQQEFKEQNQGNIDFNTDFQTSCKFAPINPANSGPALPSANPWSTTQSNSPANDIQSNPPHSVTESKEKADEFRVAVLPDEIFALLDLV